MNQLALPIKI